MLWLLLVTAILLLGRTYVWSIMLWFYGRAAQSEPMGIPEPLTRVPASRPTKSIPPFPQPLVSARATSLRPVA